MNMVTQGFIFSILTAFCWGLATIFDKMGITKISPLIGVTIRSFSILSTLIVVNFAMRNFKNFLQIDLKTLIFIICGGLLAGLIGQWTYYKALKFWEASKVTPIVGSYPLFTFLFSLFFLGESLTYNKIIGIILIILGVILLK